MGSWQAALQRRFDELEVLPASFAAAMSVLALARRDDAEIDDYAKIIGTDPALSSKLLAFTNSSWFAIQRRITTVKHAVGMVGVANVRALSVSYALAGLHSALRLNPDDARAYWESTLCKAAAARVLADELLPERADDAFTFALFQDIAVSLFAAVAQTDYSHLYQRSDLPVADQLAAETALFGADHAAWGARLGEKLKLPAPFPAAIAAHHDAAALGRAVGDARLTAILRVVAHLPHDLRAFCAPDRAALATELAAAAPRLWPDAAAFLADVQEQFAPLVNMLSNGANEAPSLLDLTERACAENLRQTSQLVMQTGALIHANVQLTHTVEQLHADRRDAERRAAKDALSGLLNRDGLLRQAEPLLRAAAAARTPIGVAIYDLDDFKHVNDAHGHAAGDAVIQAVAQRMLHAARATDLLCRWGGDEFVVVLTGGLSPTAAEAAAARIHHAAQHDPVSHRERSIPVTLCGGLLVATPSASSSLLNLIEEADRALYAAKRDSPGRLSVMIKGKSGCTQSGV